MADFSNATISDILKGIINSPQNYPQVPTTDASGANGSFHFDGAANFYFKSNGAWFDVSVNKLF